MECLGINAAPLLSAFTLLILLAIAREASASSASMVVRPQEDNLLDEQAKKLQTLLQCMNGREETNAGSTPVLFNFNDHGFTSVDVLPALRTSLSDNGSSAIDNLLGSKQRSYKLYFSRHTQ